MTALVVRGLTVRYGAAEVVSGLDLDLAAGTVTGLIGPNGAGKTSALDAISGHTRTSAGSVSVAGTRLEGLPAHRRARLGLARTFQSLELFEDLTVAENLQVAAEGAGRGGASPSPSGGPGTGDRLPSELPHQERAGLAVDRALAGGPSVVLLDEPAAGLDDGARLALARRVRAIAAAGAAVLMVDHDMGLVMDVCDRVAVLDQGRLIAEGTPAQVRADERVVGAYLGGAGVAGAPGAPTGRAASPPAAPGPTVLRATGLAAGYGRVPVVRGVDLEVGAGEVVALLGLNGAGKSTTVGALAGVVARTGGRVEVLGDRSGRAHRLARRGLACVRQDQRPFAGLTVAEHLGLAGDADGALDRLPALRPMAGRQATLLSGGEQRMLALAMALARRPRLLLVDELSLGLAPRVVDELLAVVVELAERDGVGVLLVEQHARLALSVAGRGYVLERGRVAAEGTAAQLAKAGPLPL